MKNCSYLNLVLFGFCSLVSFAFSGNADYDHGSEEILKLYISPSGSVSADGSFERPFGSLAAVRDHIRELKTHKNKGEIVVYLRGGVYRFDETVRFDSRDSGSEDLCITFTAYPGEEPVVSGNRSITNWQKTEDGTWKARADFNFRQLYVDRTPRVRARTPNDNYYRLKQWDVAGRALVAGAEIPYEDIRKASGVEFRMQQIWADTNLRIESVQLKNNTVSIVPKEPERTLVFERSHPGKLKGYAFHFENAYAFLDQPGEFFLDTEANTVYYKPLPGEDMRKVTVEAPAVETLISIQGTLDEPVKNLKFEGIVFEGTTWLKVDESGLLTLQAGLYNIHATPDNQQYAGRQPAAIYIAGAQNVSLHRNVFRNTGAAALDLHYGTRYCKVQGNVFLDIAGNGIQHSIFSEPEVEIHIGYDPEDEREICTFDEIKNNFFKNIGKDYFGSIAITCGYPRGIKIEHNEITETPYTGISMGWGWLRFGGSTVMRQNKIRYNHIHHVTRMLSDGGGIYTLSPQPDSEIAYNYIHDIQPSEYVIRGRVKGIYLDEGSNGFTVHHNVVENAQCKLFQNRVGPCNHYHNNYTRFDEGVHEYVTMYHDQIKAEAGLEPQYRDIKK